MKIGLSVYFAAFVCANVAHGLFHLAVTLLAMGAL